MAKAARNILSISFIDSLPLVTCKNVKRIQAATLVPMVLSALALHTGCGLDPIAKHSSNAASSGGDTQGQANSQDPQDGQEQSPNFEPEPEQAVPEPEQDLPEPELGHFQAVKGCSEYRSEATAAFKKRVQARLDAQLKHFEKQKATHVDDCESFEEDDEAEDDGGQPESSAGDDQASDASTTNNQVANVDEADFVKNDRSNIYVLADGAFQIVDAWPATKAHVVSKYKIDGDPKKMFVHNKRAFIYSSLKDIGYQDPVFNQARLKRECTYGYDCDFVGDGRSLQITELDIADLKAPKLIRKTKIEGSFLGARRIGDRVYTVVVHPSFNEYVKGIRYIPKDLGKYTYSCGEDIPFTIEQIRQMFADQAKKNNELFDEYPIEDLIPELKDKILDPKTKEMVDTAPAVGECDGIMVAKTSDSTNLISILGTDLETPTPYSQVRLLARPGAVYASGAHLYLASRHYLRQMESSWWFPEEEGLQDATSLHRFDLYHRQKEIRYVGSGKVKGRILNQFSLSHKDGYIRVATTTGRLPSLRTHNSLSILGPEAGELKQVGLIDDIAPTEDIRSVRFRGDKGYMVTFKKTDPLFVFDLSNPRAPSIEGELKIPGYSTYMHPMDKDHLLTIGFDAQDHGSMAYFTGIQLQIMDVSNPNNPKLVHKDIIGTRGSASAAATNHLAFNYYKRRNLLALPMVVCEARDSEKDDSIFDSEMTFNGLLIYGVTAKNGFKRKGGLALKLGKDASDSNACQTWWTRSISPVKRSVFMEDYVYAISDNALRVASTKSPSRLLRHVGLD